MTARGDPGKEILACNARECRGQGLGHMTITNCSDDEEM